MGRLVQEGCLAATDYLEPHPRANLKFHIFSPSIVVLLHLVVGHLDGLL